MHTGLLDLALACLSNVFASRYFVPASESYFKTKGGQYAQSCVCHRLPGYSRCV